MAQRTKKQIGEELRRKIEPLKLVVFDVDGTLTDGSIVIASEGEIKVFHVHDGLGIKALMRAGLTVALLTSRKSPAVARRARELGIEHVIQGQDAKGPALEALQRKLGVAARETAAMGDDLPDLAVFARSGLRLAVAEAAPEVRAEADWIATRPAGQGAAREAAELILKARGEWDAVVARSRG